MITELTARQATEAQPLDLTTIDVPTFTAAVFEKSHQEMLIAHREAKAAKEAALDITTTKGYAVVAAVRTGFVKVRTGAKAAYERTNAPLLEIQRGMREQMAAIQTDAQKHEAEWQAKLDAEDARKAAVKAEEARVEKARIDGIQLSISNILRLPLAYATASAAETREAQSTLADRSITLDEYAEFTGEAMAAQRKAIDVLGQLAEAAEAREAEQLRLQREREEYEDRRRQQEAELAAQRAEAERIAREQAEALAAQRAEIEKQRQANEQALQQERERIAAENAARDARLHEEARVAREAAEAIAAQQLEESNRLHALRQELEAKQAAASSTIKESLTVAEPDEFREVDEPVTTAAELAPMQHAMVNGHDGNVQADDVRSDEQVLIEFVQREWCLDLAEAIDLIIRVADELRTE